MNQDSETRRAAGAARELDEMLLSCLFHISIWCFSAPHSSLLRDTRCTFRDGRRWLHRRSRRGDRATTTTPPCGWSPSGMNGHALALRGVVIVIGW